jgi:hypothetical protein
MKTLLALSMVLGLSAVGCSSTPRVSYLPTEEVASIPRSEDNVDVLLDAQPDRPFKVVGELKAATLESPRSIELMRAEAARAGLDGIYWIECTSPSSGHCKAKGFVYTTVVARPGLDGARTASR